MFLLFITGAPNSGKSTATAEMLQRGAAQHVVSPGQWLRSVMSRRDLDNETADNDLANYISNNFSNEVLEPLVREHIDEQMRTAAQKGLQRILIEGYPRTRTESEHVAALARTNPNIRVVHLKIDIEHAVRRGEKRKRADEGAGVERRFEFWRDNEHAILEPCESITETVQVTADTTVDSVVMKIGDIAKRVSSAQAAAEEQAASQAGAQATSLTPEAVASPSPPAPSSFWKLATATESATIVQMQLRLAGCSRRRRQFCGSHPVSLDRANMPRLLRYPYLCSLKIDGCRFFCLVRDATLWFLNRKLQVWRGPRDERLSEFNDSLIDGELTLDNLFIVIDVLNISGTNVMKRPIVERLTFAARLGQMLMHTPFHFRAQEYVHRSHLKLLLERANQMPFRTDGIIFQPEKLPARLGIDYNLFKYKDCAENTVDLLWGEDGELYCRKTSETTEDDDTLTLDVNSGVILSKVSVGKIHPDYARAVWLKAGCVAEFAPSLGGDSLLWIPRRPRWDKHFPNMDWVIDNIMRSIRDNISFGELIEYTSRPPLPRSDVPSPPHRRRRIIGD